jgi:predicted TIM-barrel fold metal-dependent hydrolase
MPRPSRLPVRLTPALVMLLVATGVAGAQTPPLADHHQHLFSPPLAALISPAPPAPPVEAIDAAQLVSLLDAAGIRRAAVLSVGYIWGNPARRGEGERQKVRDENDWTAGQVARYPDRLVGFCGVNPLADYALEEIARCATVPGVRSGLKLHMGNSVVDYGNPRHVERLRAVFRAANGLRMAIVVHLRASISQKVAYGRREAQIFFDQILPEAADVPVQIAHLAGAGGSADPAADAALEVFIDAIAKNHPLARNLYFDVTTVVRPTTSPDARASIARQLRQLGLGRVLYGSDAAGGTNLRPREGWAAFRTLPFTEDEFRTVAANLAPYLQ